MSCVRVYVDLFDQQQQAFFEEFHLLPCICEQLCFDKFTLLTVRKYKILARLIVSTTIALVMLAF